MFAARRQVPGLRPALSSLTRAAPRSRSPGGAPSAGRGRGCRRGRPIGGDDGRRSRAWLAPTEQRRGRRSRARHDDAPASSSRRGSTNASGPADAAGTWANSAWTNQCRSGSSIVTLAQAVHHQALAQLGGALPLSVEQDGVALIDQDEVEQVAALRPQQGGVEVVCRETSRSTSLLIRPWRKGISVRPRARSHGRAGVPASGPPCLPRAVAEQADRRGCTRGPALQGAGAGLLGSGRERGSGTGQAARGRAGS